MSDERSRVLQAKQETARRELLKDDFQDQPLSGGFSALGGEWSHAIGQSRLDALAI